MKLLFKQLSILSIFTILFSTDFALGLSTSISGTLNLGQVTLGQSMSSTLTLKNSSVSQIRLDSSWFTGSADYKLATGGTCAMNGWVLKGSKSCTVNIKFSPTSIGTLSTKYTLGYFLGTGWKWEEIPVTLTAQGTSAVVVTPPTPTPVPIPTPTPIPPSISSGWLSVSGNKILNSLGQTVQLKGVNIADPEQLDIKPWERPNVTARSIASLATDNYKAKVVRLPILPGNAAYPNEGFFSATNGWDKYFNAHILPVVNDLTSKGIYVIIDLHYVSDYSNLYTQVESFWKYMAPKFAANPYVMYEIFNEPILPDDWGTFKSTIAQPITTLIRSYAPNNLILVGGPYWSSHISGAATDPVTGSNIVYIAHVYSNQTTPALWESRYGAVADKFPLFITEWGFETGGTEGGDLIWGQAFQSWMQNRGLSWTAWCFDTLWGPRMFNSDWTLKTGSGGMGEFVRDALIAP